MWADGEGFRRMVRPLIQSLTSNGRRTEPGTIGGLPAVLSNVRPFGPPAVQATPGGVALHQHKLSAPSADGPSALGPDGRCAGDSAGFSVRGDLLLRLPKPRPNAIPSARAVPRAVIGMYGPRRPALCPRRGKKQIPPQVALREDLERIIRYFKTRAWVTNPHPRS